MGHHTRRRNFGYLPCRDILDKVSRTYDFTWRRRRDYFAGAASPGKICACAQTGVCPSAFLLWFEPLGPGFESTLSNTIKITPQGAFFILAAQVIFYLWLMKGLLPTYERNGQKQGKTGNFCKKRYFWQFYTTQNRTLPQIFGVFILLCTKIPYKNNREFFGLYQGIISE